jgi:hypothetical protein
MTSMLRERSQSMPALEGAAFTICAGNRIGGWALQYQRGASGNHG